MAIGKRQFQLVGLGVAAVMIAIVAWLWRPSPPPPPEDPFAVCMKNFVLASSETSGEDSLSLKAIAKESAEGSIDLKDRRVLSERFKKLEDSTILGLARYCQKSSHAFEAKVRVLSGDEPLAGALIQVGPVSCSTGGNGRCAQPMTVDALSCRFDSCTLSVTHDEFLAHADAPTSATIAALETAGIDVAMEQAYARTELTLTYGDALVAHADVVASAQPNLPSVIIRNQHCQKQKLRGADCQRDTTDRDGRVSFFFRGAIERMALSIAREGKAPVDREVPVAELHRGSVRIDLKSIIATGTPGVQAQTEPCATEADLQQAASAVLQHEDGNFVVAATALAAGHWQHDSGLPRGLATELSKKTFPKKANCKATAFTVRYPR